MNYRYTIYLAVLFSCLAGMDAQAAQDPRYDEALSAISSSALEGDKGRASKKFARLIQKAQPAMQALQGKRNLVLFLGATGSGKTTTCHYLQGNKAMASVEVGVASHVLEDRIELASGNDGSIGHTLASTTIYPQAYPVQSHELVLCDCPGFFDNRGTTNRGAAALLTHQVVCAAANNIKAVCFCITMQELKTSGGAIFDQVLALIHTMFDKPTAYTESIFFLFTDPHHRETRLMRYLGWLQSIADNKKKIFSDSNNTPADRQQAKETYAFLQNILPPDLSEEGAWQRPLEAISQKMVDSGVPGVKQVGKYLFKERCFVVDPLDGGSSKEMLLDALQSAPSIPQAAFRFMGVPNERYQFYNDFIAPTLQEAARLLDQLPYLGEAISNREREIKQLKADREVIHHLLSSYSTPGPNKGATTTPALKIDAAQEVRAAQARSRIQEKEAQIATFKKEISQAKDKIANFQEGDPILHDTLVYDQCNNSYWAIFQLFQLSIKKMWSVVSELRDSSQERQSFSSKPSAIDESWDLLMNTLGSTTHELSYTGLPWCKKEEKTYYKKLISLRTVVPGGIGAACGVGVGVGIAGLISAALPAGIAALPIGGGAIATLPTGIATAFTGIQGGGIVAIIGAWLERLMTGYIEDIHHEQAGYFTDREESKETGHYKINYHTPTKKYYLGKGEVHLYVAPAVLNRETITAEKRSIRDREQRIAALKREKSEIQQGQELHIQEYLTTHQDKEIAELETKLTKLQETQSETKQAWLCVRKRVDTLATIQQAIQTAYTDPLLGKVIDRCSQQGFDITSC